jgi:hypothetical protein
MALEALESRCLLALLGPNAPSVTTNPATSVAGTSATLNGSVNPNGNTANALFQVSIDATLPANVVSTLAGTAGMTGSGDGTGSGALFDHPAGVAIDLAGNTYVADAHNQTIREITPAGVVTTLAGSPGQFGGTEGTGADARFNDPTGLAVDSAGNVYVADAGNSTIRKIAPGGVVTTIAGTAGQPGGADGVGASASFNFPVSVAVDSAGNL